MQTEKMNEVNLSSKQMRELKKSYEMRIKVLTKNSAHWKKQTDNLMNKYYPIIKDLKEIME